MLVVIVLLNCTRKSSFTLLSYLSIPTEIFIEPKIFYFLLCLYFILSVGFLWLVYFLIIMTVYLIGYKLFKNIIEKLQKAVIESDNNFFSDLFFNINYSKEIKLHSLDYYGEKKLVDSNNKYCNNTLSHLRNDN